MTINTDQYTSAGKAFFESQLAAFSNLAAIVTQGTEKVVALNLGAAKASVEDATTAAKDLLATQDPQAFFALATALSKSNAEKIAAYNRYLTDILSSTKVEFAKVAEAQVADAQSKISALMDSIAQHAPAGSENVIALMKSSVATAHAGYEHVNNVTKQATQATEAHVAQTSEQFAQAVKKAAAK